MLSGAHPAAVKPLVETLLEGHAPGDPQAPCVHVCFSPRELQDAPAGARVVLVGAEREPEWLNLHRPVVRERSLVLLLWVTDLGLEPLRRNAPDFLDWVSHRVEVPRFAPEEAARELELALARAKWIAVAGAELVAVAAEGRHELDAKQHYDDLAGALESGDVLVRGLERDDELWRLLIAHAEVQWRHRVVLAEPRILPPFSWIVDARVEDWEQGAVRLESLGVDHARLVAGLQSSPGAPRLPFASALEIDEPHVELLGRVARAQLDHTAARLAQDLGLEDLAERLEPSSWSDEEVTPERLDRVLRGGLRERRGLADYVVSVVERAVFSELLRHRKGLELWPDLAQDVAEQLYRDDGRALRRWDPAHGSFSGFIRGVARTHVDRRVRTRSTLPPSPDEQLGPEHVVESQRVLERALALLDPSERSLFEDYFIGGMSASEIAEKYQSAEASVRRRIHRIRLKLRALLDEGSPRPP